MSEIDAARRRAPPGELEQARARVKGAAAAASPEGGSGPPSRVRTKKEMAPERRVRIQRQVERALDARAKGAAARVARAKDTTVNGADVQPEEARTSPRKPRRSSLTIDDLDSVAYESRPIPEHLARASSVIKAMPRRKFAAVDRSEFSAPPVPARLEFKVSTAQVLWRVLAWISAFGGYFLGTLRDKLLRRDSVERRAQRLLQTFQQAGGTFVKIGQQLAMRVDVLPYAYCKALTKLLDAVKPFPAEQAMKTIERAHGKPLHEVFEAFDPVPIGSASIACVYQAVLKGGQKVAVKVRRPNVGQLFAADLDVMRWGLALIETFALIRPGSMGNFVRDFESSIMEELDFRKEAEYQDLFRRYAGNPRRNKRPHYFTAPKVYFGLSSSDVIVQEFSSGIWAWEILAAVEQNDQAALARMRELNIDPKVVAKRLIWASYWSSMSHFVFHADPHPANIVVKSNNQLVFIDFGACGTMSSDKRALYEEFFYYQRNKDVHRMVQCALGLLEPLPHIDIHQFEKELETLVFEAQMKLWSKHSHWYERTSAVLWLNIMDLTRRHQLPVNLDTVRMFRANMLYDSLAIRFDNDLRADRVHREFIKDARALSAKSVRRSIAKRRRKGLSDADYTMLNDVLTTSSRAFFKLKRFIGRRGLDFSNMIEKPVMAVLVLTKTLFIAVLVLFVWCSGVVIREHLRGELTTFAETIRRVSASNEFQILIALIALVNLRRIFFRLNDREIGSREIN